MRLLKLDRRNRILGLRMNLQWHLTRRIPSIPYFHSSIVGAREVQRVLRQDIHGMNASVMSIGYSDLDFGRHHVRHNERLMGGRQEDGIMTGNGRDGMNVAITIDLNG